MAAQLEDGTLRVGLLMEAAQAQQTLAATALDRLREHTAGLDAVVRDEIRATILEEMRSLGEDGRRAAEALRGLRRAASLRVAVWSVAMAVLSAAAPCAMAWWILPTRGDIAALGAERERLTANIARLSQQGARLELRRCGAAQRLCVRVDRSAPSYGEAADFLVVRGY